MNQFSILECNMDRLERKLTRIANKCRKYGCEFSYNRIGEEYRKLSDENNVPYTVKYIIIEVEGLAEIQGWKFIAELEHTNKGNIVKSIADVTVPSKYYTTDPICEHCKTNRYRKNTYLIQNEESGEFIQVGKACLKDYTGGMDAEGVAQFISAFDELIKGEEPSGSGYGKKYYGVEEMLRFSAETVKHFGYTKVADNPINTATRTFDYYGIIHRFNFFPSVEEKLREEMESVSFNAESEYAVKTANDALEWILKQEEDNNYIHNLKTICGLGYLSHENLGFVVSLIPMYFRAVERQINLEKREQQKLAELESEKSSIHIGNIGERIVVKVESVKCITSWENDYGITRVYKISDTDGNVFTWKTSKFIDEDDNKINELKGTVKEHKVYNGINQTELTRCKLT